MSTPNGQHPLDPNGASSQATSTVLALDGWGPVIAEPPSNGSNGSEPEAIVEEASAVAPQPPGNDWRQSFRASLKYQVAKPTIDPRLVKVLAPAATMTIAIVVALRLGSSWRQAKIPAPTPTPPSRVAVSRRRIALMIDPSLIPVEPQRSELLRRLRLPTFLLD